MKKFNNKSGFTLIEIIVVLIIVGILAAIALPNLFQNVAKSKSGEALSALGVYKTDMEGCLQAHYATSNTNCGSYALIGVPTPNTTNWTFTGPGAPADGATTAGLYYTLTATSNAGDGTIVMNRYTNGSIDCKSSTGIFQGVC